MAAREDARTCERCGHKWFATRIAKAPKPRWFDDAGTPWGSGAARVSRLQGNYERSLAGREQWSKCPNCGSIKVKTVSQRNFVPTGSLTPQLQQNTPVPSVPVPPTGATPPAKAPNPLWVATKAFMKVHWRIVLAIFCTIGIFSMAFGGEEVKDRVGGSLAYLVAAIVFWTLHIRHSARTKPPAPIDTASAHRPELDLTVDDGWSQRLSDCQTKASVFNEVAAATKSEPVRLWLSNVSDDIEAQLATADDLATLGRSVEPSFDGNGEPQNAAAREAWTRLATFESGLDEAITSAAHVRLNSASPNADMDAIHSQLAMLREQLPTLESP